MQTYVGEPIINPVVDSTWNSFDVEKAKKFLNRETLPSAKTIVVYPIRIGNEESSFRVIIFSDNFFYSELSVPVQKIIEKDEAINLAKEKGLEEPINIVLMTNDNLFGWSITSSKDSNAIKEGEINQVTINMRSGNVSSNVFNPVVYKDKPNMSIILIITFLIVLLVIIIALVYRRRQKNEN